MKVLFVHDGPLIRTKEGKQYHGITLNDKIRQRYLQLGDELRFLIRVRVVPDSEISKYGKIENEHFSVAECPNSKSIKLYFQNHSKVKKLVRKEVEAADFLIIRLPSAAGNLALQHAKKINKPYLIEVVACPWDVLRNHSWKGKLLAPFKFKRLQKNVIDAPYVMYVTEQFLQKRYPTHGKSIGLSDVELAPIGDVLVNRNAHIEKREGKLKLTTVSAIDVGYKGHEFVLKALSELRLQGIEMEYHLVGSGSENRLKNIAKALKIEDLLFFHGVKKHAEIFDWYDKMDIYIHPSKTEGLPRTIVEALSRGCFCLGSNVGGIPELVDKNFLFEVGNVGQIVNQLKSIDKSLLLSQAERNVNRAKDFELPNLESRRTAFYAEFKDYLKTRI